MPQKSRRKPKKFTGASARRSDLAFSTKWQNLVEFQDERGKPFRRFYKLETLTGAIDKMATEQERFLAPAIQQVLGKGRITSITFTLHEEDPLRFVFHARVNCGTRKRTNIRLVVAKNQEEATRRVAVEFKHLSALYGRIPEQMVQPLRSGVIFLPDRYRRKEHHREVGAYITTAPSGYEPLGIHRNHQFMSLGTAPHTFSKRETEALKAQMSAIVIGAFDSGSRDGIDTHQIERSTFEVYRPSRGLPRLMLFNCVHMQPRLTPSRLLGFLLTDSWTSRGVESPLTPDEPRAFFKALVEAVGAETAKDWVIQFARQAAADKIKAPKDGYVEALSEVIAD
jgi:hypothetical protein